MNSLIFWIKISKRLPKQKKKDFTLVFGTFSRYTNVKIRRRKRRYVGIGHHLTHPLDFNGHPPQIMFSFSFLKLPDHLLMIQSQQLARGSGWHFNFSIYQINLIFVVKSNI